MHLHFLILERIEHSLTSNPRYEAIVNDNGSISEFQIISISADDTGESGFYNVPFFQIFGFSSILIKNGPADLYEFTLQKECVLRDLDYWKTALNISNSASLYIAQKTRKAEMERLDNLIDSLQEEIECIENEIEEKGASEINVWRRSDVEKKLNSALISKFGYRAEIDLPDHWKYLKKLSPWTSKGDDYEELLYSLSSRRVIENILSIDDGDFIIRAGRDNKNVWLELRKYFHKVVSVQNDEDIEYEVIRKSLVSIEPSQKNISKEEEYGKVEPLEQNPQQIEIIAELQEGTKNVQRDLNGVLNKINKIETMLTLIGIATLAILIMSFFK